MYGRDEQRYYTGRIEYARDVLYAERDKLETLLTEYHDDTRASRGEIDDPQPARLALIAARTKLTEAMEAYDRALAALPKVAAPPAPEHVHPFGGDAA